MKKFIIRHIISIAILILFAVLAIYYGDGFIFFLGLPLALLWFFLEWIWFAPSKVKSLSIAEVIRRELSRKK